MGAPFPFNCTPKAPPCCGSAGGLSPCVQCNASTPITQELLREVEEEVQARSEAAGYELMARADEVIDSGRAAGIDVDVAAKARDAAIAPIKAKQARGESLSEDETELFYDHKFITYPHGMIADIKAKRARGESISADERQQLKYHKHVG